MCTAHAMHESSSVAVQPPWIEPMGLKKAGFGVPWNTARPRSTSIR